MPAPASGFQLPDLGKLQLPPGVFVTYFDWNVDVVSSRASDAFLDFVCGQDSLFTCSDIRQSSLVEFTPFVHLLVDFNVTRTCSFAVTVADHAHL